MSAAPVSRTLDPEILLPNQPTRRLLRKQSDFVEFIWRRWLDTIEAIIEVGQALIDARAALEHGEFLEMIQTQLPFGEDKAQRLMAIARNPMLSNTDVRRYLPAAWTTLYELTRVPDDRLAAALQSGQITPNLAEHQARALWRETPADRPAEFAVFHCPSCKAQKLRRSDTRRNGAGEVSEVRSRGRSVPLDPEDVQSRLYECEGCGVVTLTEEVVVGPFGKKSLAKTSARGVRA